MFRAVAIDLDGTTLRSDGTMSALLDAVLAGIARAGVHIVPATARPPRSTFGVTAVPTYAACCNGALLVKRSGEVLWERTFDSVKMTEVVSAAESVVPGLGFGVRAHDVIVGNKQYFDLRDQPRPEGSVQVTSPEDLLSVRGHSLSFRATSLSSGQLAEALSGSIPIDFGQISISARTVLDVAPAGISKATGLAELGKILGFQAEEVLAYGDMANDVAMLSWAGLGVAVGAAHPEAVAAADLAIGSPDQDAVASHLQTIFPYEPVRPAQPPIA